MAKCGHIVTGKFDKNDFNRFNKMAKNIFWYQPIHYKLIWNDDKDSGKICKWALKRGDYEGSPQHYWEELKGNLVKNKY